MSNERKGRGAAFWTIVAVVMVLVIYPLSFWPACTLVGREILPAETTGIVYWPLVYEAFKGEHGLLHDLLCRYATLDVHGFAGLVYMGWATELTHELL